ncbi:MAG: lipid II flippase MurJ [Verrucomicrobiales bacterium]|nr:lipid II flippase MurJ [Verrucomicrobiales bacterium]
MISSLLLSAGLLLSKAAGFARDWLIANVFGATVEGDIAVLVVSTPDILIGLIGNAGLLSYITTRFREEKGDLDGAKWILRRFLLFGFLSGLSASIFLIGFEHRLISLLAPGLDESERVLAVGYIRWALLCLPVLGTGLILSSWANATERYGILSFCNLAFNLPVIAGLIALSFVMPDVALYCFAGFVVGGVLVRFVIQSLALCKLDEFANKTPISTRAPGNALSFVLACLSGIVPLVVPLAGFAYSSLSGNGSVVIYNLLYKVGELPMVFLGAMFATALLPRMVDKVSPIAFRRLANHFLFLAIVIGGISAALLSSLHEEVFSVLESCVKRIDESQIPFAAGLPLFLLLLPKVVVIFSSTVLFARRKYGYLALVTLAFLILYFSLLHVRASRGIVEIYWGMFLAYAFMGVALLGCILKHSFISIKIFSKRTAILLLACGLVSIFIRLIDATEIRGIAAILAGALCGTVLLCTVLWFDHFWGRILRSAVGRLRMAR